MQRTVEQNRRIWRLVGELSRAAGMNHDSAEAVMRDMVREITGQDSTRQLSRTQADELIVRLEAAVEKSGAGAKHKPSPLKRGDKGVCNKRVAPDPEAITTPEMKQMMQSLFEALGWTEAHQQRGLYKKVLGPNTIGPVTRAETLKIIEALKNIWLGRNKLRVARAYKMAGELHHALMSGEVGVIKKSSPPPFMRPYRNTSSSPYYHRPKTWFTKFERDFVEDVNQKIRKGHKLTPRIIMKIEEIYAKLQNASTNSVAL